MRKAEPDVSYREDLLRRLKEPKFAAAYLNECLDDDEQTFLIALHDVADAHGGLSRIAKKTRLNREHLFRMLSKSGNPQLSSLRQSVSAMGFKLALQPA